MVKIAKSQTIQPFDFVNQGAIGDVLFLSETFSPISILIREQEGDSDESHVALLGPVVNGKRTLFTTGASHFFFYGQLPDVVTYVRGKNWKLARYPGLTPGQQQIIHTTCESMKGQGYGFWKVIWLIVKSKIFPGTVKKLGFGKPSPKVKNPFCSEAVAYAYWKAGIRINPRLGKQEPAAYTPENLFNGLELIYPESDSLRGVSIL